MNNKPQCLSPQMSNTNKAKYLHESQKYKANASGLRNSAPKPLFGLSHGAQLIQKRSLRNKMNGHIRQMSRDESHANKSDSITVPTNTTDCRTSNDYGMKR